MLTRLSLSAECMPTIKKTINGKDSSSQSAFPYGTELNITVEAPRALGASAVVLRLRRDGEMDKDTPLRFRKTELGADVYEITLNTKELCGESEQGLFYYELLFLRGADTLFSNAQNYVDYTLGEHSDGRFMLLVYKEDFKTPDWFKGRIMYHIFVDRFRKGEGEKGDRDDVIINEDWDNGVMQYPKKAGDELANNMFFGGDLWGVAEKLDYLKSLGVGIVYLSPIFEAYSNHKYDTGDYNKIDAMFGGEAAFEALIKKAEALDIKIILDGVFNHTGDDSLYFDKYGRYGGIGAYSSPASPYKSWYRFRKYPTDYEDWWGIKILPKLNHTSPECRRFFVGEGGVCERYVKEGIGGWRLDVADELSDEFLDELRRVVKKASKGEAIIIGEVWENAAEKISYSKRRRYLRGAQLDSVMNYPLRNGILELLINKDATLLSNTLISIYSTYPKCVCDCLMNLLGTHDTERILTLLGDCGKDVSGRTNDEFAVSRLSAAERKRGIALQKLGAVAQYTVYGVPSVFYGDEAGVEGYSDPFCRRTYPWGAENKTLLGFYRKLGRIRRSQPLFVDGDFRVECARGALIAYTRYSQSERITVVINASETESAEYKLRGTHIDLLTNKRYEQVVPPMSAVILK